jgi:eukaryotic-like serine/threonine-protein kinase
MSDLYVARAVDPGTCGTPLATSATLVILKTLRPPITEKRVDMFLDEARLGVLFDHPNVPRTFSLGEEAGRHFIAMELLDGQPLDRLIERIGAQKSRADHLRCLLWILAESLAGLHYAHELSADGAPLHVVHRDFTPQNLFVTYDGRVKTLDFGVAKSAGRITRTTTGEVKGKVRYMAPEQALGLRIDRRADLFAAGIILFELCSGTPLWRPGIPDREVFDDLIGGIYPLSVPTAEPAVNAILGKALARDASERYRTAAEMREDLLRALQRGGADRWQTDVAKVVATLFASERERTEKMLAQAQAAGASTR